MSESIIASSVFIAVFLARFWWCMRKRLIGMERLLLNVLDDRISYLEQKMDRIQREWRE